MLQDENYRGEPCHDILVENIKQELAFREDVNYEQWKNSIREKLYELSGLYDIEKNVAGDLEFQIEYEEKKEGYTKIRFSFASEIGTKVPCYLLVPDTKKDKYPVAITLQGHSTGFHNSVGEIKFDSDVDYQPRGQFGLQAVENGYIALCIEQRGMGERRSNAKMLYSGNNCNFQGFVALGLGRTLIGERMYDTSKAIDVLEKFFPQCDTEKILITGNSGGGTASYYAACYDERIKLCVPSCAFCSFRTSILSVLHCVCNFIPSAYKYFEMQDLACLIAPRPIAVITGEKDPIFPIEGVEEAYHTLSKIYAKAGASDACRLVVTPKDHWWCVDIVWNTINEETEKLGW